MGIITKKVLIKMNPRTRGIYSKIGYDVNQEEILVNVTDLKPNSTQIVEVECDYCGEHFETKYYNYYVSVYESFSTKTPCKNCRQKKNKETVFAKYGVDNISSIDGVQEKKNRTCQENFGCEYPMQSKKVIKKSRKSMLKKYGFEHNLQREDIKNHVKIMNSENRYKNGSIVSSKAQRYICELYNGKLNYPVGYYNLDILLDDNIFVEYNGSGHDLNVKRGQITKELFIKKESIRYHYVKSKGYKEIIFDNLSDKLPSDDTLLDLKNKCIEYFKANKNSNWIRIDLDTGRIKTKYAEIFYMIN